MCVDVHSGNIWAMDDRLDPMTEPMRCAHGREFIVFGDTVEWLSIPCDACVKQTVAIATTCAA